MSGSGEPRFTLAELVEASGLPERTVQYWITEGLVSPALGRGRARYYTPAHLLELTRVQQLRAERLSIEEIRQRLTAEAAPPPDAAHEHWRRIRLHPDLELHLRDDAPEGVAALARELAERAREWFGDEG